MHPPTLRGEHPWLQVQLWRNNTCSPIRIYLCIKFATYVSLPMRFNLVRCSKVSNLRTTPWHACMH